jgi:hypothetical protein
MKVKYPKPIKVHGAWDEWFNAQPEGDPMVESMIDLLLYDPLQEESDSPAEQPTPSE